MPVNKDDPRPPFVQVADVLREQIHDGRLAPGEKLPSIKELSRQHEVAAMTVQRALGVLRAQELVVSHQGRGVFVNERVDQAATEQDPSQPGREPETLEDVREQMKALQERLDRLERAEQQQRDLSHGPGDSGGRGIGL